MALLAVEGSRDCVVEAPPPSPPVLILEDSPTRRSNSSPRFDASRFFEKRFSSFREAVARSPTAARGAPPSLTLRSIVSLDSRNGTCALACRRQHSHVTLVRGEGRGVSD